MKVENSVIPTQEQMDGFLAPGPDGPISMVNLLKFREKASYEDGRETTLTGLEAYAIYSAGVVKTLAQVGGQLVFHGKVTRLMLGEVEELWDTVAISISVSRCHARDDDAARISRNCQSPSRGVGGAGQYWDQQIDGF